MMGGWEEDRRMDGWEENGRMLPSLETFGATTWEGTERGGRNSRTWDSWKEQQRTPELPDQRVGWALKKWHGQPTCPGCRPPDMDRNILEHGAAQVGRKALTRAEGPTTPVHYVQSY